MKIKNCLIKPLVGRAKLISFLLVPILTTMTPVFAETTECTEITSIPITITQQGVYCFKKDFSVNISDDGEDFAIEIKANNVTIDFNNYKLGNLAAGPWTGIIGIYAFNRKNITLKNGNIRGFREGILMSGLAGGGHIIENNLLDSNTTTGIGIGGKANTVRNNTITNTGLGPGLSNAGGVLCSGSGNRVLNNDIHNTIGSYAKGIYCGGEGATIIKGNRVTNTFGSAGVEPYGIDAWFDGPFIVEGNIIINSGDGGYLGIHDSYSTGYCKDNIVINFTTENFGCTDGGGNSFSP